MVRSAQARRFTLAVRTAVSNYSKEAVEYKFKNIFGAILKSRVAPNVGPLLVNQGQQRLVVSREVLEVVGEGAVVERRGVGGRGQRRHRRGQQAGGQLRGRLGARREQLTFAFLNALQFQQHGNICL